MSSRNPIPARGVMPGRILKRELEARGWTQKDLAEIMGRPPQAVSEIVNGTKQITPETALELAEAFGIPAEFWTNLEARYQLWLASKGAVQGKSKEIARKSCIYSLVPIRELVRRGWIQGSKCGEELEEQVLGFLRISSPDEAPALAVRLRAGDARSPEAGAQVAWVRRVEALAGAQRVGRFDAKRLGASIPDILGCAARPEDVSRVPGLLAELGMHLLLVPHLPRTYLDGAAFAVEGEPVVALTLRYDRIDAFWFTLLHELAHILKGHAPVYLENLDAEPPAIDGNEAEANSLARDWLLEPQAFRAFVRRTQPYFSKAAVLEFASSQGRHPGIVVGRLHHEGLVEFSHLRALLVRVKPLLKDWIDVPAPQ